MLYIEHTIMKRSTKDKPKQNLTDIYIEHNTY